MSIIHPHSKDVPWNVSLTIHTVKTFHGTSLYLYLSPSSPTARIMESKELLDKWMVRSAQRLINLTESLICQNGARYSISEAEGFSLLHQRAAALLNESNNIENLVPTKPATLVYHRTLKLADPLDIRFPFELHAANAQEAVYHCLIAHDVSAKLGIPGLCSIDDANAQKIQGARMPSAQMIADIAPILEAYPRGTVDDNLIIQTVQAAFAHFSSTFNIKADIIDADNLQDNGICIIPDTRYIQNAPMLVQMLTDHGVPASNLVIKLIKPYPTAEIAKRLQTQKCLVVLGEHDYPEQSAQRSLLYELLSDYHLDIPLIYIPMQLSGRFTKLAQKLDIPERLFEEALSSNTEAPSIVIGAVPGGQMSRSLLFDLAAYLNKMNGYSAFQTRCRHPLIATLGIEKKRTEHSEIPEKTIDLLFLSHPGVLEVEDILDELSDNAVILVLGRSVDETSIWPFFSPKMRAWMDRKHITAYSLAGSLLDEYRTVERYGAYVVHGALLELFEKISGKQLNFVEILNNQLLSDDAYKRIEIGRNSIKEVDKTIQTGVKFDPYFAPQISLPRMLSAKPNRAESAEWRSIIRNFYVRGQSTDAHHHPLPGLSIRPAALNHYLETLENEHYYPLLVTRMVGNPTLQTQRLDTALHLKFGNLLENQDLQRELRQFIKCAEKTADATLHITLAGELLTKTLEIFESQTECSEVFRATIEDFIASLPQECHLVGLNPHTLLDLYVLAVRAARRSRMRDVRAEIRGLITLLREALRLDDAYGPIGTSESALNDAFGPAAFELLNTAEIAHDLEHQHRGHVQHDPVRIARMYESLHTLESFLKTLDTSDDLIFAYPPKIQVKTTYDRVKTVCHDEPIAIASGLFDAISQTHIEAFKAMRMARLDIDNAFDPAYHGDILEHFTWQDLSEDELRLLPVICIAETSGRLYEQLTPLSRLIRSGKPLDVLVFESTSQAMNAGDSHGQTRYDPGFSYLATAYREAFVTQTTLARPEHLAANLSRMNRILRPAIAVVACPTWEWRLPARVQLEAAHYGRTSPMFQYDPSIGETRVERFNVNGNPQIDSLWPDCEFSYVDEQGQTQKMASSFTFAHALALQPGYHRYFRILPNEAWNDELIEIGDFLKNPTFDKPQIPYIWGVVDSNLRKCIMTRDVANACIDRMQRWKTLRELSMSTQAQLQLTHEVRESQHAEALEASQRTIDELREKLAFSHETLSHVEDALSLCLNQIRVGLGNEVDSEVDQNEAMRDETAYIEGLAGDAPVQIAPVPNPNREPLSQTPVIPEAALHPVEPVAPKRPFIDSSKCLSCGACVGIDDKTFGFNEDGQAIIIREDATPEDCQEAADACPAGCIVINS